MMTQALLHANIQELLKKKKKIVFQMPLHHP